MSKKGQLDSTTPTIETKTAPTEEADPSILNKLEKEYAQLVFRVIQEQNLFDTDTVSSLGRFYDSCSKFTNSDINDIIKEVFAFINKLAKNENLALKTFEQINQDPSLNLNDLYYQLSYINSVSPIIDLMLLKRLARRLDSEIDPQKKLELLSELKKQAKSVLEKGDYFIYNNNHFGTENLSLEILESGINESDSIVPQLNMTTMLADDFREISTILQKSEFEMKFQKTIGCINTEVLETEKRIYGAKGANLEMVLKVIQEIQDNLSLKDHCFIPDFKRISTSVYKNWKNGENIRNELAPFFQWINQRKVMVRSSAVHSEDNENTTGAGIYESVPLDGYATIDKFENAIITVFKSVDTEKAKNYRAINGIKEDEEMGIVLQEFVPLHQDDRKGYTNTVRRSVPELMEIVFDNGFRPLITRDILKQQCVTKSDRPSIYHYQIDSKKYKSVASSIRGLSMISFLLEKYYDQPLQIEFILVKEESESSIQNMKIALLQTRFLPHTFLESAKIEFPSKEEALFEGAAVGIIDSTFNILPNDADNSESEGVVIFKSSRFGSACDIFSDCNFPKKGVVLVLGPSREGYGHIETLCAEKGLILIFNEEYQSSQEGPRLDHKSDYRKTKIDNLQGHKTVRVVSNGLLGKIYPAT